MTDTPFYAAEVVISAPGSPTIGYTYGLGTHALGTLALAADAPAGTDTLRASDSGYRTREADAGGLQIYPALLDSAFQIDRRLNLDPAVPVGSAAWGTLNLANPDNRYDSLAAAWNADGRGVKIYWGTKVNDDARGYLVDPAYASLSLVFAGVATPWFLTDTELQIPIRDATYWLDRPVQSNLYTGGGSYGGDATLAGLPLPKARGGTSGNPIRNVTPILIDATNRIYQYTDAAGTIVALYEGGDMNITFSANTTNLYAGSTPAGQYRTDNSRGLFQLGSTPARTITVDCTGEFPIAGAQTTAASIARYLLSEDLLLPAGNLETASFTSVDSTYPYTSGVYFDPASSVTGLDALALLLSALGAKIIPLRTGQLRLLALRALPVSPTTIDAFNLTNIVRITPSPLPAILAPPPYRFRVGYQHSFTMQTSGLSPNATMAKLAFLAAADRLAAASSSTILGAYNRPNDPPIIATALQSQADAAALATALVALWCARRRIYDVTLPVLNGLVREIGDVVSLTYPMDDLSAGKSGQIVGEQFNAADSSITFQVLV